MEASLHAHLSPLRLSVSQAGASLQQQEVTGLRQTAGTRWVVFRGRVSMARMWEEGTGQSSVLEN